MQLSERTERSYVNSQQVCVTYNTLSATLRVHRGPLGGNPVRRYEDPATSHRHLDFQPHRRHDLLIYLAVVNHPTCDMPTLRVMVRPMDGPAFLVPDILAVEVDVVAYFKSVYSRGDVDVVSDQQRLSRRKLNDESLVSRTVQIVGQNANHLAFAFDLYVAGPTRKRDR